MVLLKEPPCAILDRQSEGVAGLQAKKDDTWEITRGFSI